jgi:hypothetical protein
MKDLNLHVTAWIGHCQSHSYVLEAPLHAQLDQPLTMLMICLSITQPAFDEALLVLHGSPMDDDFWQAQIEAGSDE